MANSAEKTKKQSTTRNTARLNKPFTRHIFDDELTEKNHWNRGCGLLAMDYGSGTTGYIWNK